MLFSLIVRAMAYVDVLVGALASRVRTRRPGLHAGLSPAAVRGVTFIEYALMASIAIGIGILIKTKLGSFFTGLFTDLGTAVSGNKTSP